MVSLMLFVKLDESSYIVQMDQVINPDHQVHPLRECLGQFATGVTIVTTRGADGEPVGLTANSFNSVSLNPPLVLWSLAKRATSLALFAAHSHYAINILAAGQIELARRFATRGLTDRFAGVAHREGSGGVPLLDGCVAWFECANLRRYDEGDHVIFVGAVEHCAVGAAGASPLIFHGGRYFTELPLA
jgi:flavin reductase (DIM6/NTAB) family NADH-FMN oxidoreductase RutF